MNGEWRRLDIVSDGFTPSLPKRRGGTIRHNLKRLEKWPIQTCTECGTLFHKHYYTHQCWKLHRRLCYECLKRRARCKVCKEMHTKILK